LSPVSIDDSIVLAIPDQAREMPLRIVYPQQGGSHPVIVLSHGTFSSGKRYDPVAVYWAERGYVVILPDHIDANYGVIPKKNEDMFRVIRTRVSDMSVVLDALDEIERQIPTLAGRLDRGHLIAAGHSVGTQIAMMVTGLRVRNPTTDEIMQSDEKRFSVLVMLSDPGKMALMPATTWTGSRVPTLLSTGTDDYGLMGDGRRAAEYQNEILSAGDPREVSRYLLSIERGDHYFGGLIHKATDGEPDNEGLAIFNAVSAAFLDAYAKGEQAALRYLRTVDLEAVTDGRAMLTPERQN
jgi:predicted alpha/beta-hydrolase family hydrolase